MVDKISKEIKVYGNGRLYNPDTGEYFVKFVDGEATINEEQAKVIREYHKQIQFEGEKTKQPEKNIISKTVSRPKSFRDANKPGLKIPGNR